VAPRHRLSRPFSHSPYEHRGHHGEDAIRRDGIASDFVSAQLGRSPPLTKRPMSTGWTSNAPTVTTTSPTCGREPPAGSTFVPRADAWRPATVHVRSVRTCAAGSHHAVDAVDAVDAERRRTALERLAESNVPTSSWSLSSRFISAVAARRTTLAELYGVGPVTAAIAARFARAVSSPIRGSC
jgi:hypothetical protein